VNVVFCHVARYLGILVLEGITLKFKTHKTNVSFWCQFVLFVSNTQLTHSAVKSHTFSVPHICETVQYKLKWFSPKCSCSW